MFCYSIQAFPWLPLPYPKVLRAKQFAAVKVSKVILRACSNAATHQQESTSGSPTVNFSGVKLQEAVAVKPGEKLRLDSWISSRVTGISRARVQSSIRSGLVSVNGRVIHKASYSVRGGDLVDCTISELQPLKAEAESIPLDIVYEDDHLLVVNKPPHMVVHPAPGNASGTLVNGILHHCSLPTISLPLSDDDEAYEDDISNSILNPCESGCISFGMGVGSVRPGIVHRLDKGTSGLLVVAKDEHSHSHLAEQFQRHSIKRIYVSLTCGVPSKVSGRIEVPIGRDIKNRLRMAAIAGSAKSVNARHAASRYRVVEVLAHGGSALVEWKLETGRTHQIRAHAKYLGFPLLGDETYGGTKGMALSLLHSRTPANSQGKVQQIISQLERPCLHALTLGFVHPKTGEKMQFSQVPPMDFAKCLDHLRELGTEAVSR